MSFLYPGFLFAWAAIAIPVIIHLFNFKRFKKIYFSNVSFLQEIKEQNSSKENLKNLLILICRVLAVIFLVLAFSRPYLPLKGSIDANKGNIISIYIDNSYSMEAVNKEGSLLDEAKRRAKEIVKSFGLNDRFQLLSNDFEGKHQRLLNADDFLKALDEVKISPASRKIQQVIDRQQGIFSGSSNRFAIIISDFQRNFMDDKVFKLAPNTHLSLLKLHANNLPNVAVDSVWFISPIHQIKGTEKLVVSLKNYGQEDAKDVSVKLNINGVQKALTSLNVEAGKTKKDTLSFSGLNRGWQKASVSIKDFPLTFDDELNFSFEIKNKQDVLSINGQQSGRYISALFGADRYFKLVEMPENNVNYAALSSFSLVTLNGLENPSTGLAQELNNYLRKGGTIIIFPSMAADKQTYTSFLNALKLPGVADLINVPTKVNAIELKNPLFKDVFESFPDKIDLPKVNKFFSFKQTGSFNKETILQLPLNRFFLAKYQISMGHAYLAATDLDPANSNFAQHPVFVPLMYKIAFESAKDQPIYYHLSKDNVIETERVNLGANQSLKLVADRFEAIPEMRQIGGKTMLYLADQIKKAGFYDLKKADSTLAVITFNNNRSESDMHYYSQAEIEKAMPGKQVSFIDAKTGSISSAITLTNNGTELWKLCLILALIFLALEIILIKFYTTNNIKTYEASR